MKTLEQENVLVELAKIKELLESNIIVDDKLLTDKQVAEMLGFGRNKVWKLNRAKNNNFPRPVKINGSTRWKNSMIQDYIKSLS